VHDAEVASAAATGASIVYVDPATDLPVRIEDQNVSASIDTDGVLTTRPEGPSTNTYLDYLPRTPGNLELLVPPVPAGYAQVDQLALDEVRAAGCVS
jgi:hypothetical protein